MVFSKQAVNRFPNGGEVEDLVKKLFTP